MKPKHIKRIQARSRGLQVRQITTDTFVVTSISNPVAHHIVTVRFGADATVHARCTCPWAINHGIACAHVMAALEYLAGRKARTLSFWSTADDARRQKHRLFLLTDGDDGVWITSRSAA